MPCTPHPTPGHVIARAPAVTVLEDVVYRPLRDQAVDQDRDWGIYGGDGRLCEAAEYWRGPGHQRIGQSPQATVRDATAQTDMLVYGGVFFDHFGHFIVTSMARLWPFADPFLRASLEPYQILFHAAADPSGWFDHPFVAELLGGLGLDRSRFVRLEQPTRVRRLITPSPSLVEMSHVHPAFIAMTRAIGRRLSRGTIERGPPLWLSRTRLAVGTQGWGNEGALEAVLRPFGVDITHPERRSISELMRMFDASPVVAGTVASAFHVSLFCEAPPPAVLLSPSPIVNPTFGMLDAVAGLDARYFYVESDHRGIDMRSRLWSTFTLRDPAATARALLVELRAACRP